MNWKELKDFCNSLDEGLLEEKVMLWREEEAIGKIDAECLGEDHFIGEYPEDGCVPESDVKSFTKEGQKEYKLYLKKGHPILWEDFS